MRLKNRRRCNNNSKHRDLSLLYVLEKNNTKVGELSGDCILHGVPELLIFLTLSFGKGFHGMPYHVLHLISSKSSRLCIVQRSRA